MRVNIFGLDVPLVAIDGLYRQKHEFAFYDVEEKKIYYDSSMPLRVQKLSIMHKMGHAMFDRLGLDQNEILAAFEESLVEQFATIFSENEINLPSQ